MKKTTIFIVILMSTMTLSAQTFEWAKSFGGTGTDVGSSVCVDANGNVYTTGTFTGTVDFDPGVGVDIHTSASQDDIWNDIFIQKLDANGNFVWAKTFGNSTDYDKGHSIQVDVYGNVYVTGEFTGTIDFDPGAGINTLTSAGGNDIFVLKLDAGGNFVWAKAFAGPVYGDIGKSVTVDNSGNVYIAGTFANTVDFDPSVNVYDLTSAGWNDIFVEKLDANGDFVWAKSFAGTSNNEVNSIEIDAFGNVYTIGLFAGTVDFNPSASTYNLTSAGSYDIFIQKFDASGNFIWAKSFGESYEDKGYSLEIDASGNLYATGYFYGTVDFDPGANTYNLTSNSNNDIFVLKLDANGDFIWAKSVAGVGEQGSYLCIDTLGNVYTTGMFHGVNIDFDPGVNTFNLTTNNGHYNVFLQKLDSSGNFVWAKSFDENGNNEYSNSITIDALGNLYTTGRFYNTVDFNFGVGVDTLTSLGSTDVFVRKMSQCFPTSGTATITACDSYTWIDGVTYTSSNNTATDTLVNAAGCDSIVTLNLTINNSTAGTDVVTACDSYTWINGVTYFSSNNTATDTLTNTTGCDSIVTLNLTINTVDISVTDNSPTLIANATGATYKWLDCDNNSNAIAGETNQSFTAAANGNYSVEVTANGCTDTSACVNTTGVGIVENDFGNQLMVYPNPSNGNFAIDFGQVYAKTTITITDINGKLIYSKSFTQADMINVSIKEVPAGVYLTRIESGEKKAIIKLIKE